MILEAGRQPCYGAVLQGFEILADLGGPGGVFYILLLKKRHPQAYHGCT